MNDELQRKIDHVTERLVGEFALSSDDVRRRVETEASRYANATIPTFVPTLVERNVRSQLRSRPQLRR